MSNINPFSPTVDYSALAGDSILPEPFGKLLPDGE